MVAEWHRLASQKLFLSETLLRQQSEAHEPVAEAMRQGSIELALRGRQCLLTLIARHYQYKTAQPRSLDELVELIGPETREARFLAELNRQAGSWWNHLEQLEHSQAYPAVKKKTVSDENIISVAAETGPDRSSSAIAGSLEAMRRFLSDLTAWHDEW
ncbi:hypothetical protein [Marinobacter sp.]|uniref:hypothetical protein n=1 Tax=Marinobacter sp. TaxID=50741 RepID=UPI003850E345